MDVEIEELSTSVRVIDERPIAGAEAWLPDLVKELADTALAEPIAPDVDPGPEAPEDPTE
jgi:hypothetical protein